jgi:hypothetical protein
LTSFPIQPSLDLLADLCGALDREMARKLHEHVALYHQAASCPLGPEWLPFARQHIPDAQLVGMIEVLETDPEADVYTVADQFGYPTSLVAWHLAEYRQRFDRALRELAGRRS